LTFVRQERLRYLLQRNGRPTHRTTMMIDKFVIGHALQPGQLLLFAEAREFWLLQRSQKYLQDDILSVFSRGNMPTYIRHERECMLLV
jgi:hypothetical protein